MRNLLRFLIVLALAPIAIAQSQTQETLDIYVFDTEGGESVLYIAPTGETLLFDTGGGGAPGANERDFKRILTVVEQTNVQLCSSRNRTMCTRSSSRDQNGIASGMRSVGSAVTIMIAGSGSSTKRSRRMITNGAVTIRLPEPKTNMQVM